MITAGTKCCGNCGQWYYGYYCPYCHKKKGSKSARKDTVVIGDKVREVYTKSVGTVEEIQFEGGYPLYYVKFARDRLNGWYAEGQLKLAEE